jgi:DNA repair protein RadC
MSLKNIPTSEILAELYERQGQYITKKPVIDSPEKVAQIFIDLTDTKITTESVWMLTLNVKNRLINKHLLADGIPGAATIEPQRIFRTAMDDYASAIVLVHNHPSGDTNPSRQDVNMTESVAKAGRILGISVHDHVIVSSTGHKSLRETNSSIF